MAVHDSLCSYGCLLFTCSNMNACTLLSEMCLLYLYTDHPRDTCVLLCMQVNISYPFLCLPALVAVPEYRIMNDRIAVIYNTTQS